MDFKVQQLEEVMFLRGLLQGGANHLKVVKALLEAGADPNLPTNVRVSARAWTALNLIRPRIFPTPGIQIIREKIRQYSKTFHQRIHTMSQKRTKIRVRKEYSLDNDSTDAPG